MPKTQERILAETAAESLSVREKRTARALIRSERRTLTALRTTISLVNDSVVGSLPAHRSSASAVRQGLASLQPALVREISRSRGDARTDARVSLEKEIDERLPNVGDVHLDEASAVTAAAGLSAAWGAAALLALAAGNGLSRVPKSIDSNIQRTASTETASAFNDERDTILILLGGGDIEGGPGARARPLPGLYKVWSAVLDARTCERCFAIDGTTVEANQSFASGPPPLHPRCRCVVEHVIVTKPDRLEDVAFDYDLFKQELRDVIREGREKGEREALRFVSESLGSKRSPVVLAKRFANEPYATRR